MLDPTIGAEFGVDNPVTGPVFHGESLAPWDFNGGGTATAFPWTVKLAAGSHVVRAVLTRPDGTAPGGNSAHI